jgi:hypothetical protein
VVNWILISVRPDAVFRRPRKGWSRTPMVKPRHLAHLDRETLRTIGGGYYSVYDTRKEWKVSHSRIKTLGLRCGWNLR